MEGRAISTFMGMFSPTRSPFYAVVVAGMAALGYVLNQTDEWETVRLVAYPFMPLILVFGMATFLHRIIFTREAHDFQLVYARTIGIVSAIASTVVVVTNFEPGIEEVVQCAVPVIGNVPQRLCTALTSFETLYLQTLGAGLFFLSLGTLRSREGQRDAVVNLTQVALIMAAFLGGGCYFATLAMDVSPDYSDTNIPLLFAGFAFINWWIIFTGAVAHIGFTTRPGITNLTVEADHDQI